MNQLNLKRSICSYPLYSESSSLHWQYLPLVGLIEEIERAENHEPK